MISRDAQTYLTKTGAKNAKHFAKKLKENLKQRQLDRLGKADPSIATLMPSFQGGQPFSVQLEPTWDQFYKAGLYVSIIYTSKCMTITLTPTQVTDGFESHYTYNYPSEPRSIVLSNGSIARGSLPIHNIDDQGRGQSGVFRAMSGLGERGGYNPVNMKEVRSFNESLNSFVSHPQPVPSSAQGVVTAWDEGRQVPVTVRCEISLASWEDARAVSGICDVPLFNKQREERQSQRTVGGSAGSSRN
jgi:hypothetical protein